MMGIRVVLTWGILAAAGLGCSPALAQAVAVEAGRQQGHGYMVSHGGSCYLVLPRHVAEGRRAVSLTTAAPVVEGRAFVEEAFWEGLDLAVGTVTLRDPSRCEAPLGALEGRLDPAADAVAVLVRLRDSGEAERVPMRIGDTGYLTFEAEVRREGDELYPGTSGAMLMAGERPVGMAVEMLSGTTGRFVRIEEVGMNAARWIRSRGRSFGGGPAPAPEPEPAAGLAVEVVSASALPLAPETGPGNLLTGAGAYLALPEREMRIRFRVAGEGAAPLSLVRLESDPEGEGAVPRRVRIEVSSSREPGRLRPFARGEMPLDGRVEFARAPTLVRWIDVVILGAWSDGPVRLDRVGFE